MDGDAPEVALLGYNDTGNRIPISGEWNNTGGVCVCVCVSLSKPWAVQRRRVCGWAVNDNGRNILIGGCTLEQQRIGYNQSTWDKAKKTFYAQGKTKPT